MCIHTENFELTRIWLINYTPEYARMPSVDTQELVTLHTQQNKMTIEITEHSLECLIDLLTAKDSCIVMSLMFINIMGLIK